MALTPLSLRLFCDLASPTSLNDLNRNSQPPTFYRGDDIEIDIGLGQNGNLFTALAGNGPGGIASVTAQLFQSENDTNAPMMSCVVLAASMNLALTQSNWNAGGSANSHASFIFSNSQTAISLNGQASVNYWLRITAQTTDATTKNITFVDGPITVRDGPAQALAISQTGAAFGLMNMGGQTVPVLLDTTTGLYHQLAIFNNGGVLTLQIGDTGYPAPVAAAIFPTGSLFRTYTLAGQIVPQIVDTSTGLYHTLSILNVGGVLTLQLSDTGY